ncbi:MAG: PAS domain S-box protein, partial [Nitrospirae bacterium]
MVDEDIKKKTVLLLLGDEDRAIFKEILSPYYEIAVPEKNDLPEEGFDLCILDYPNFKRHERAISKLKQSAGPVIVPFVLVMDRGELSKVSPDGPYDEVILRPVERTEALKRVSALLKTKELSLDSERFFNLIPDAISVLDSEGNILRYNRALQRFSGTDEDLRGRKCYEVMCKDEFL